MATSQKEKNSETNNESKPTKVVSRQKCKSSKPKRTKKNQTIKSNQRRVVRWIATSPSIIYRPSAENAVFFFVLSFVLIYDRLSGSFRDFNKSLAGDWCLHLVHFVMSSLIRFLLVFTAFFLLCDSISLGFYRFDRVPLGSIRFYWIFMLVTVFSLVLLVFYIYRFDFEFY